MILLSSHSHYSFMWSPTPIDTLCHDARALGYTKIALTDTDNLCGMWQFINACKQQGLSPVIGAEITDPSTPQTVICLAKNLKGYQNLCHLITQRHRHPAFSLKKSMPPLAGGLAVITSDPDLVNAWHTSAMDLYANLKGRVRSIHHPLCAAARKHGVPIISAPDIFFLSPAEIPLHRMLRAIGQNTSPDRLELSDHAPDTAFLPSPDNVQTLFQTRPDIYLNTCALAEKLHFTGPDFGIVMPPYQNISESSAHDLLKQKTICGAKKRYGATLSGKVIARIEHELSIIRQKNFCTYFLVVQHITQRASLTCGRGSGAASIIAYCLGITNICPIKHNLYFERFLNPERTDPPDIDVDFAWDERDTILNQVLSEFKHHSAMVSSHILFQPRMAVRETAKAFGLPDTEISKISRRLPWFWKLDETEEGLLEKIKNRPEFRFMDFPQPWPEIMAIAQSITGTPSHLSVHPGGVIITPEPIHTYVPIQTAPKGVPLIQWEKDSAETAGLVKIDLLGNRSLGVIRDTITTIERQNGKFNDFSNQDPEDDYDTRQNVAQGNTMGCFYIESPATRLLQKKSRIGDFNHVVLHSSIIRPAANEFIQEYIKRLHTGIWEPIHPLLSDVLNETYGIMVYQEDVSKVAVKIAGFSHAQADSLRKIMSKKSKHRVLKDYYRRFRKGALKNQVSQKDIDCIWKMIISFSGYSFCKPHSASYARVSFQAAYLKTHYPAEFMAAVISNQGGFYTTFAYVSEARRMGLAICPPDVNSSQIQWTGTENHLQVGLFTIKNLSAKTMKTIIKQRRKKKFTSLGDFFSRTLPHEDEVRQLIYSGSLDSLCPSGDSRADQMWQFTLWQKQKNHRTGPTLFDQPPASIPTPNLPRDPLLSLLRKEFAALGFLCRTHPITLFDGITRHHNAIKAIQVPKHIGCHIIFAGWLITGKTVTTKKGDPMKFFTFEDETGLVETVFFPNAYARLCHLLTSGRPHMIYGLVEKDWGTTTLNVKNATPLTLNSQNCIF